MPAAEVVVIPQRIGHLLRMTSAECDDRLDPDAIDFRMAADDRANLRDIVITDVVIVVDERNEVSARLPYEPIALGSDRRFPVVAQRKYLDLAGQRSGANLRGQPPEDVRKLIAAALERRNEDAKDHNSHLSK